MKYIGQLTEFISF